MPSPSTPFLRRHCDRIITKPQARLAVLRAQTYHKRRNLDGLRPLLPKNTPKRQLVDCFKAHFRPNNAVPCENVS